MDVDLAIELCFDINEFVHNLLRSSITSITCLDPEGGHGVRTPLENYKNIGFLSNTGPDPLKTTKPVFNIGLSSRRQRNVNI